MFGFLSAYNSKVAIVTGLTYGVTSSNNIGEKLRYSILRNLQPITFESYLPSSFKTISEEIDTNNLEEEVKLIAVKNERREPTIQRLLFTDGKCSSPI